MVLPLVLLYSLAAALSWGISDFSGGVATKKSNVLVVLVVSQILGLSSLFLIAYLSSEDYSVSNIYIPLAAGIFGGIGLISLYRGLALGKMSIVAPFSAVISTSIPVFFSFLNEGIPSSLHIIGLVIALIAIFLLSYEKSESMGEGLKTTDRMTNISHGAVSGIGFGLFFVFIDQFDSGSVYWPLILLRISSISFFILLLFGMKASLRTNTIFLNPMKQWKLLVLAGIGDTAGNVLFTLATQTGRLDIAAMLSSLFPLITIILARLFYKEQIRRIQKLGIVLAISAVLVLSIS